MKTAEKHGGLFDGSLTEEAINSSKAVLQRHRGGGDFKGLQQWFSPPEAAELMQKVFRDEYLGDPDAVLDFTAGNGALLEPYYKDSRFGIEIDRDHAKAADYNLIGGDAQKIVPMLRASGLRFPAVAINPPFGLTWTDPVHKQNGVMDSTALSFLWAQNLLDSSGQGAMISGRDKLYREVMKRPESKGVYAIVEIEGEFWPGVAIPVAISFFVRPEQRKRGQETVQPAHFTSTKQLLPALANEIKDARGERCRRLYAYARLDRVKETWKTVRNEYYRRVKAASKKYKEGPRYDVGISGSKIHARPGAYAKMALATGGLLREIELLDRQALSYFGQNPKAWANVEKAEAEGWINVDPALKEKTEAIRAEAELMSTPLFRLKDQMRLGWIVDADRITCKKDDPDKGYQAGRSYAINTRTVVAEETEQRLVENKQGEKQLRQFVTERKLLAVDIGEGSDRHTFNESGENIAYLVEHFEIPDPGDVAEHHPEAVQSNREVLEMISAENGFTFKEFQKDHLSRLLTKGRGMLAHEQGLGKTLMLMALAEATVRIHGAEDVALFVAPQDLLPQWAREAKKFFGREMEVIRTQGEARDVARRIRNGETGWWITHYEALSRVGTGGKRKARRLPPRPLYPEDSLQMRLLRYKQSKYPDQEFPNLDELDIATTLDACPECNADTSYGYSGLTCDQCGHTEKALEVKPAYSHLTKAFNKGVVCIDEVSEMRGDTSLRSKAIRALARGPHKYGGTGTPLSNYINDSFWGLWFCLGNASAAFPYGYDGKTKFEADFCVIEHMMGTGDKENQRQRKKVLPKVTNVSQFWRLTQPGVSRCRKEQTGEPLVPRIYRPIRVPMGVAQQKGHAFWLRQFANYFTEMNPDHNLVYYGLVEKWQAALGQRWRLESMATLPEGDMPTKEWWKAREDIPDVSNWTPANLKVLELAMHHAAQGEKVLIGSDLILTGKWIADRLIEKGVRAVHITEEDKHGKASTKAPGQRAAEVKEFVEGEAQVLCAGINAMKLGHNLDVASTVIVHGLPDSHMSLDQYIARVHRLTSTRPVSVYVIVPKGSLAERKWALLKDKGGASDLAFDGEINMQDEEATDWNKILKEMRAAGIRNTGEEVLEADVKAAWDRVEPLEDTTPDEPVESDAPDPWELDSLFTTEAIEPTRKKKETHTSGFVEMSLF